MFGVGLPELIVIAVIALLIFGPDKLPELTQKFGRFAGQTRKMSDSVRREFYNAVYTPAEQFRRDLEKGTRELLTAKPHLMGPASPETPTHGQKVDVAMVDVAKESKITSKTAATSENTAPPGSVSSANSTKEATGTSEVTEKKV